MDRQTKVLDERQRDGDYVKVTINPGAIVTNASGARFPKTVHDRELFSDY